MLLFSRVATLTGNPRQVAPWAIGITDYVNAHSNLDVTLWSATFGYPVGTFAWSTIVESHAALADDMAKLLVDEGYLDMVDQAMAFIGQPGQDILRELVHGAPGDPPPVGSAATITTATAQFDRMIDAVGWSVEAAQYITEATGAPVSVLTNVYGQLGEITWIAVQPDVASGETIRARLNTDADYLGRMPATKELFIPGSGHVSHAVRMA